MEGACRVEGFGSGLQPWPARSRTGWKVLREGRLWAPPGAVGEMYHSRGQVEAFQVKVKWPDRLLRLPAGLGGSLEGDKNKIWRSGLKARSRRIKKLALSKASGPFLPLDNPWWSQVINPPGGLSWPEFPCFEVCCPRQHEEIICCLLQWTIRRASRPNDMWEY